MSREGQREYYVPTAPPQDEVLTHQVQYINSYPNNYIYHNKIEIDRQIKLQNEQRDRQVALQIQKMENELQQEKEKKSIWKKLCLCLSCLFCCCITCGV